jgi:diaminohydroxyphosphoribosylaminopyrimidine deaminase/5-amino-6-(5-phosphoribosylamino)uracil reductase
LFLKKVVCFSILSHFRKDVNSDELYMKRALALARRGRGRTRTNPMVGAVLVVDQGGKPRVVGEGFHRAYGGPHAEVEAVRSAHGSGFADLSAATLYVNLEPCCHFGKTPPCTDLIVRERIHRVVCGTVDPFPEVSGKGVTRLRNAGVNVTCGVLEEACRELNRVFFKLVRTGLPWVTIKMAQSLDGRIAAASGSSKWISSETSRRSVHRMRSRYDAVLVGAGTVLADDPELTVRLVRGRHPRRIVVDGRLRIPMEARVLDGSAGAIVITSRTAPRSTVHRLRRRGVVVYEVAGSPERLPLRNALKRLVREQQIASVLVEGGAFTVGEFLRQRLADDLILFVAPRIMGSGKTAVEAHLAATVGHAPRLHEWSIGKSGDDLVVRGRLK